jgi:hypothetical protein
MNINTHYQHSSATIFTEPEPGSGVVLQLDTGEYHQLNAVACYVWDLLETPTSGASLVAKITEQYSAPEQEATQDVAELLASLLDRKLIEPASN